MEINDNNSTGKNSFKIRRRKTFIDENGENTSKIWKKRDSIKINSLSKNKTQKRKSNIQFKKNNSIRLSLLNYKNIEEEVKKSILEMRRACLWELRRQSYDLKKLERKDKKKENRNNNNGLPGKFSSKYLNNYMNDKILDKNNENKYRKSQTIIIKKNDFNKQKSLFEKNNEKKLNNNINKDKDNNLDYNINELKPKSQSTNNIKKVYKKKNNKNVGDKFRFLSRGGLVIDSYEENESDEEVEPIGYLINPETNIFFIYDLLIALGVLYSLVYTPYELASCFCIFIKNKNIIITGINIFIDFLFLIDLILNFFLEYYSKENDILVKINAKMGCNYISGWFFIDFLASLPINIYSFFYCKKYPNYIGHTYEIGKKIDILILFKYLKALKVFEILSREKNQFITKIKEKYSDNIILGNIFYILNNILFVLFSLHIISCIYIFIGKHTYPGWIFTNDFQNHSFSKLYIISIYYITTTLTTVGYGDISSDSLVEICFRLILITVGIIGYSWIISSISNGINKENFASINFNNECQILEDIRISYKKLPYSLYLNIINHLKQKHFYQKKYDKNLLINNLPYSLKNNLIFSMYKISLEKFDFFKNISNSNFLVDILSCFSPISAIKDDILLKENDLIEEIFFVREGKLALEVSININNPEESINKYLSDEFLNYSFDFDLNLSYTQLTKSSKLNTNIGNISFNLINSFCKKENKNTCKNVFLKIHDIHKNEDYGDIFMFFTKRSPFALRVKTKRVKLFTIKKIDFINICGQYKNVFRDILKKKKINFQMIKNILIKTISKFCNVKGIQIHDRYTNTIKKAINELNKEIIPIEILKNLKKKNEISEIDEEINRTLKDFDNELSHLHSNLNIKEKRKPLGNIKKVKSSHIKKNKNFLLEDFYLSSEYESKYYSSIKNKKKKKYKKVNKNKATIKTNVSLNKKLQDINFNYSESDETSRTVKIKEKNESSSPKTIQILPKSLLNSLKTKIKYSNSYNKKKDNTEENNIFICINNNYNYGNNIKNINANNNYINNIDNIIKNKNSSRVTFNKIFCKEENNNIYNNKEDNSNYKKKNYINYTNKLSIESNHKFNINNKELKNKNNSSENLSSTSVDSFEIKRSYNNINQITKGNYIKDIKFQENALKYIKHYNDCNYNLTKVNKIINNKEEKHNNSGIEIIKNKNCNNNKINYFHLRNSIKSVKTSMSNMFFKKLKINKNPMNKINISKINDISLSSQKQRSNSLNKEYKELCMNSIIDNYNNTNQNTTNNNDNIKKYNYNDEIQRIDIFNKKNTKLKYISE